MDILYRYDGSDYSFENQGLTCSVYKIERETKYGYWVTIISPYKSSEEKWVSKSGKKRLCYPTKKEAAKNLYYRCQRRLKLLNNQINRTHQTLNDYTDLKIKLEKEQNDFINNPKEF